VALFHASFSVSSRINDLKIQNERRAKRLKDQVAAFDATIFGVDETKKTLEQALKS
jgi:hypothetical protein